MFILQQHENSFTFPTFIIELNPSSVHFATNENSFTHLFRLLSTIKKTLNDLVLALDGMIVMTDDLEQTSSSIYNNQVPRLWAQKSYPSDKNLSSWIVDLEQRFKFIRKWIAVGSPNLFWLGGFFSPQAFLTAILQQYARRHGVSIDTIAFDYGMHNLHCCLLNKNFW